MERKVIFCKKNITFKNMKFILFILILFSVQSTAQSLKNNLDYVGSIDYDSNLDKLEFKLCNPQYIYQYPSGGYGLLYEGEMYSLKKIFFDEYINQNIKNQSGMIRIQFIVNCNGEIDRFRMISSDKNYNSILFDKKITSQLLAITKSLKGWGAKNIDYYQYLIFKIKDGNLIEILP